MREFSFVAVMQPQWKRYQSDSALRDDLARFLRVARNKGANVALFPEYTGLTVTGPLAIEKQHTLKKQGGLLSRLLNSLGGPPELADTLPSLIADHSAAITERYTLLFGDLAREFRMTIVAGTMLARVADGVSQYRAGIFDAEGNLMGWQSKLHLGADEASIAEPGDTLQTFDAPFGRFGVLVGHDILFPELARALAFRGCIGILNPTMACGGDDWRRQRLIASARAQENQIFIAQSFFVGTNDIFVGDSGTLVGKSAIIAPVELSPRGDALLAEMGAERAEGVVVAEWNTDALSNLWQSTDTPVRSMMRSSLFYDLLASEYQSGATLSERVDERRQTARLPEPAPEPHQEPEALPPLPAEEPQVSGLTAPSLPAPIPVTLTPREEEHEEPVAEEPTPAIEAIETDTDTATGSWLTEPTTPQMPEPLGPPTRTIPIIDPETGRYLGEKPS